jgi:anti-sigma regulatory factor (Ser/Thr protein kinase)
MTVDVPPLWSREIALAPDPRSAAVARQFVREHLVRHDLDPLVEDVTLVASELASNVVLHAGTPFTVRLSAYPDAVILAVGDGSVKKPVLVHAQPDDVAGRGIAIMDMVSRDWGVVVTAEVGKSVWASFDA